MFKRRNSKKGDKKKGSLGKAGQREGEERESGELPQVWLPTPQEVTKEAKMVLKISCFFTSHTLMTASSCLEVRNRNAMRAF